MQTKEQNFKNLVEFIKIKKDYYFIMNLNDKTKNDKLLYFYECLYLLLENIEIEFDNNNQ